jgi:hypothetical protein
MPDHSKCPVCGNPAWDRIHGPRIPDEIKALVRAELDFLSVDSTDNLRQLHAALDALPPDILRSCGIDPEPKR